MDAKGLQVRERREPVRPQPIRVLGAVPVPAVNVGDDAVRAPVDLASEVERARRGLDGRKGGPRVGVGLPLNRIWHEAHDGIVTLRQAALAHNVSEGTLRTRLRQAGYPPLRVGAVRPGRVRGTARRAPLQRYLHEFERALLQPDDRRSLRMNAMLDSLARIVA